LRLSGPVSHDSLLSALASSHPRILPHPHALTRRGFVGENSHPLAHNPNKPVEKQSIAGGLAQDLSRGGTRKIKNAKIFLLSIYEKRTAGLASSPRHWHRGCFFLLT
jgi:hypothetical protein